MGRWNSIRIWKRVSIWKGIKFCHVNSVTECRAISWFLFLLVFVLSLLFSVMSLVLSWNSSTERSKGEVIHGFYFFLSCLWSCQEMESGQNMERSQSMERRQVLSWNSLTECSKEELFHGFYFRIWKGVRLWKGVRSCHVLAWLNVARESYFMVSISFCLLSFLFLSLSCI